MTDETRRSLVFITAVGILLRVLLGYSPYSGESTPPHFGDYEAQRHWMELTTHLPVKDWYTNSDVNDSSYWPLDYPPLTAFHEYVLGYVYTRIVCVQLLGMFRNGMNRVQPRLCNRGGMRH